MTWMSKSRFARNGNNTLPEIALSDESVQNPGLFSDRFLEDGSFLRLSNLTLGYNFDVSSVAWLDQLRVYFVGTNLVLWSDYRGYDPEINRPTSNDNGIPSLGVDWDNYPKARTFQLGVHLSFF